ncbi:hypothetical protein ACSVC9_01175 [Clostridium sp. LBM24168]
MSNVNTPNAFVIKRLLKNKIVVLKTDCHGNIIVRNGSIFCNKSSINIKLG